MYALVQNLRFAFRQLRKAPSFTLTVVLTLALGIGATTAIFSLVEGVLLRPLAFKNADRLVLSSVALFGLGPSHSQCRYVATIALAAATEGPHFQTLKIKV